MRDRWAVESLARPHEERDVPPLFYMREKAHEDVKIQLRSNHWLASIVED